MIWYFCHIAHPTKHYHPIFASHSAFMSCQNDSHYQCHKFLSLTSAACAYTLYFMCFCLWFAIYHSLVLVLSLPCLVVVCYPIVHICSVFIPWLVCLFIPGCFISLSQSLVLFLHSQPVLWLPPWTLITILEFAVAYCLLTLC